MIVRPVVADDLAGLDSLLESLDSESRYMRWFSLGTDVHRAALLAAHPTTDSAVGLVALAPDGELIGHAASIAVDEARAEVCFEVAARWRHLGIAGRLLGELVLRASERGLEVLVAQVLMENADMLAVFREYGPCQEHQECGAIDLELRIGPRP